MKKLHISLRWKIMGAIFLLLLCSCLILGFLSSIKARAAIEKSMNDTAISIIGSIAETIDIQQFNQLRTEEDMENDYYIRLRENLNEIREATGLKYLYTMRKAEDGRYIYVVDGMPLGDPDESLLGDVEEGISDKMLLSFEGSQTSELDISEDWGSLISVYVPLLDGSGIPVGIIGADFDATSAMNELNSLRSDMILVMAAVILAGLVLSAFITNILVRSIKKLNTQVQVIKNGDLTVKIEEARSRDEIGTLTEGFRDMVANLNTITSDIRVKTRNIFSEIDFLQINFKETNKANEEFVKVIEEIASGASEQVQGMENVSVSLNQVFDQVTKTVENAKLANNSSENAITNIEQVVLVFQTLMDKVNVVSQILKQSADIIRKANERTEDIMQFSEIITQISRQTNMLALNASIEAARAGEQGQGFAVVANEVKSLAGQAHEASQQIDDIIANIRGEFTNAISSIEQGVVQAEEGAESVTRFSSRLNQLKQSSAGAYAMVESIVNAIRDIDRECRKALKVTEEVADLSRSFSAGSQQAVATIEEQSAVMQQMEERLRNIGQNTSLLQEAVGAFKTEG